MTQRAWGVLALLLFLSAGRAAAQTHGGGGLVAALDRVSDSWARGDYDALAALASREGMSIDIDNQNIGPLTGRMAAAVLRRIFDERVTVKLKNMEADNVGSDRAFAALEWTATARGTTIPEKVIVFVALKKEDGGWRVTQIRLLP